MRITETEKKRSQKEIDEEALSRTKEIKNTKEQAKQMVEQQAKERLERLHKSAIESTLLQTPRFCNNSVNNNNNGNEQSNQ